MLRVAVGKSKIRKAIAAVKWLLFSLLLIVVCSLHLCLLSLLMLFILLILQWHFFSLASKSLQFLEREKLIGSLEGGWLCSRGGRAALWRPLHCRCLSSADPMLSPPSSAMTAGPHCNKTNIINRNKNNRIIN